MQTLDEKIAKLCAAIKCLQDALGGEEGEVTPTNGLKEFSIANGDATNGIGIGAPLTEPNTKITYVAGQSFGVGKSDNTTLLNMDSDGILIKDRAADNSGVLMQLSRNFNQFYVTQYDTAVSKTISLALTSTLNGIPNAGIGLQVDPGVINFYDPLQGQGGGSRALFQMNSTYLQPGYMGGSNFDPAFPVGTIGYDQSVGALKILGDQTYKILSNSPYIYGGGKGVANGGPTTFTITHDVNNDGGPTKVMVAAGSADAAAPFWYTWDDSEITVTYLAATPVGSGNIVLNWIASF